MSQSFPMHAVADEPDQARVDRSWAVPCLREVLAGVSDPWRKEGQRFSLVQMLLIAFSAALAGKTSYVQIGEWSADLPACLRLAFGLGHRRGPCEPQMRKTLQRIEPGELTRLTGVWLAAITARLGMGHDRFVHLAIDGKTLRGSGRDDHAPRHVVSLLQTATDVVLAAAETQGKQPDGQGKGGEIGVFKPLLASVDLGSDVVVSGDALYTQTDLAGWLTARGLHFVYGLKGNQPATLDRVTSIPWADVPDAWQTREKGHGRIETRTYKICQIPPPATGRPGRFPEARQAIRVIRRRRPISEPAWSMEVSYFITDLDYDQITPAELAGIIRSHWRIEMLHWERDVVFAEDASQARTGHGPLVLAQLRNFAYARHRATGSDCIAAATRHTCRHPASIPALLR